MAIYHQDVVDIELTSGSLHRSFLNHSIGSSDNAANRFGIRVFRNGNPEDLTGTSCQGYFRDSRGNNIALTSHGAISGNVAYVTLPQACYNYPGKFTLSIKLVGGGVTGTMRIIDGVVDNTNTGGAVAPTGTVPTYQEVLAAYDEMSAMIEEWNGGNNEVTAQIQQLHDQLTLTDIGAVFWEQGSINADGSEFDSDTRIRSGFIYLRDLVNLEIRPATGWAQSYLLYNEDRATVASYTEWSTGVSTIEFGPGSIYARVVLKRTDASDITPADAAYGGLTLRTILHREYSEITDDISDLQDTVSGLFSIDGNTLVLSN